MEANRFHSATLFGIAGMAVALIATVALISGCSRSFASADRVVRAEEGTLTVAEENGLNQETHEVAPDAEVTLDGQPAALEELDRGDAVRLKTEKQEDGTEVVKKIEAKSKEELEADTPATDSLIDQSLAPLGPLTNQPVGETSERRSDLNESAPQEPLSEPDEPIESEDAAPQAAPDAGMDMIVDEKSISGTISSLGDNQFEVKDQSDSEHTITVNGDTKYTLDGNEATFDDLLVNHSVHVAAEKDGDNYIAEMVDATSDSIK